MKTVWMIIADGKGEQAQESGEHGFLTLYLLDEFEVEADCNRVKYL